MIGFSREAGNLQNSSSSDRWITRERVYMAFLFLRVLVLEGNLCKVVLGIMILVYQRDEGNYGKCGGGKTFRLERQGY